jgi:serine/threonine protein kinase
VTAPLTVTECELLEAVAQQQDGAQAVLGDYWITNVDEERGSFVMHERARLAADVSRWREPLVRAGFDERDLVLANGFLQWPLCVPAGDPLDGDPLHLADLVRISPRYFREHDVLRAGVELDTIEAEAITPRTKTRAVIKSPREPEYVDILEHELAILQLVDHRNVIRPFGRVIRRGGVRALALPWAGIDLRRLLTLLREHGRLLGDDVVLAIAVQLLDGLAALHAAGIAHREVRPDHVMVAADGTVRVIDFGTASHGASRFSRYSRFISPSYPVDWRYRMMYMSVEQTVGDNIDARTDLFSVAGLIAELATNVHPLMRQPVGSDFELVMRIRQQPFDLSGLPAPLRISLAMALERDRERRPAAADLRETLRAAARQMRLEIGPHVIARRLVELGVPA